MARFFELYREYRRVGLGRLSAFHFAWLVTGAGAKPVSAR